MKIGAWLPLISLIMIFPLCPTVTQPAAQEAPTCTWSGRMLVYMQTNGALVMRDVDDPASEVIMIDPNGGWDAVWSPDGCTLAYYAHETVQFWRAGETTALDGHYPQLGQIDWSPDGQFIAFDAYYQGDSGIFAVNVDEATVEKLTGHDTDPQAPHWSPDGTQIAYGGTGTDRNGDMYPAVFVIDRASGEIRELVAHRHRNVVTSDWSPDGRYLAFIGGEDEFLLQRLELATGKIDTLFTSTDIIYVSAWSPDGTELMFGQSFEDVYVMFHIERVIDLETGKQRAAFAGGGAEWSPDGASIAFWTSNLEDTTRRGMGVVMVRDEYGPWRTIAECIPNSLAWHPSATSQQ